MQITLDQPVLPSESNLRYEQARNIAAQRQSTLQQMRMRDQLAQQQAQEQQRINQLRQAAISDPEALRELSAISPESAKGIIDFKNTITSEIGRSAAVVKTAPLPDRADVYKRQLQRLQSIGYNIDQLPSEYDPSIVDPMLEESIGLARDIEKTLGVEKSPDVPSSIREYQFFEKLDPQKQQQYLNVKRNIYGQGMLPDGSGNVAPIPGFTESRAAIKESEERGKQTGKYMAESEANLATVVDNSDYLIKNIEELIKSPGLEDVIGVKGGGALLQNIGVDVTAPGTKAADFKARLDQLGGAAFLQAYETLKGGGQITEVEGKKATDAIARLSSAQTEKQFKNSANEFIDIIKKARTRALNKVKKEPSRSKTDLKSKYGLD